MTCDSMDKDTFRTDDMHVVHPRAAGMDVHKMQIPVAVRISEAGGEPARSTVREFSALPDGLRAMTDWLQSHGVTAAAMEGTGIYWLAPFEALEDAGIHAQLFHAQHVKQIRGRKTDTTDSLWLARICQFGLAVPSFVPPRRFRQLRMLSRYRRQIVREGSRARNRVHKTLDHDGLRLGGVLTDIFGVNGRRILDGLIARETAESILASLTPHLCRKLGDLARALAATLDPLALITLRMRRVRPYIGVARTASLDPQPSISIPIHCHRLPNRGLKYLRPLAGNVSQQRNRGVGDGKINIGGAPAERNGQLDSGYYDTLSEEA